MASKRKTKKASKPSAGLPPAPSRLSKGAAQAWDEIVAAHGSRAYLIVGPVLEEYCEALAVSRAAAARVAAEGLIVSDAKGRPIDHPALAIAARAERTVERLSARFAPPVDRRRRGYLSEKTLVSVHAAGLDKLPEYAGAVGAVMTLALVIDNAQAMGAQALQKTAFGPIQSYLQGLEKLGLTPRVSAVAPQHSESERGASVSAIEGWISSRGA